MFGGGIFASLFVFRRKEFVVGRFGCCFGAFLVCFNSSSIFADLEKDDLRKIYTATEVMQAGTWSRQHWPSAFTACFWRREDG